MGIQLLEYRGHIRNWGRLCDTLQIDKMLSRDARERELLIKAYQKWGTEIGNHLYGMFCFVLKDDDRILAFRDQFGVKPFYYYVTEQKELLCGSFIRDILSEKGFCKELNEEMLQNYLTLTYVGGENTFFKGLKKLMPGHYLIFENGEISIHRYWIPEFHPDYSKSVQEYADEIHHTMKVIMNEVQDEEGESFLSSGVDSSYVLAMSKNAPADTCGYENKAFDESELAEKTAMLLGRQINRYEITPEEYFSEVPYFCQNMEQPLGDASAIVYSIACQEVAKHADICYSGEGSDEFFGGYRIYKKAEQYKEHLREFYAGNTMIMKEDEKQKLLLNYREGIHPVNMVHDTYERIKEADPLSQMMTIDMELWLEGDIYLSVDKMSTACGLEVRMPITDVRMFELASRIPPEYKVTENEDKLAFRMAAGKVLPDEIAFRKKLGFIVPIRYWLADSRYNREVKKTLFGKTSEKFFCQEALQKLFDDYIGGNSDLWRKIWTIYIFLVWYDIYFTECEES